MSIWRRMALLQYALNDRFASSNTPLSGATGLSRDQKSIRRFLLHALPDGFHRIRHYGFLAKPDLQILRRYRRPLLLRAAVHHRPGSRPGLLVGDRSTTAFPSSPKP
jgi:hypothetical protein